MMELPILFSTPMVQAILDERKNVTRRVIKPQPNSILADHISREPIAFWVNGDKWVKPPYQPGDKLWVRETWFCDECDPDCAGRENEDECPFNHVGNYCYGYKAQYTTGWHKNIKWRPSIFMPKEAARIWLEVVNVRVERVQDITAQQALKEGIDHDEGNDENLCNYCPVEESRRGVRNYGGEPQFCVDTGACEIAQRAFEDDCIDYFAELWNSTIKKEDLPLCGWDANPYVWVIEFKKVKA